jgi:hypothetical protein
MQMRVAVSQPLTGKFYDFVPKGTYNRQDTGTSCNTWQYARDVRNIARNLRKIPSANNDYTFHLDDTDYMFVANFLGVICYWDVNTQTYLGTRPWLGQKYNIKAISALTNYYFNLNPAVTGTLIAGQPILANMEKEKYYINGTKVAGYDGVKIIPTPTLLGREPIVEPKWAMCRLLDHVSRDFKKIPLNATEKSAVEALVTATTSTTLGSEKNPSLGTKRGFGDVAGAVITTSGGVKDISSKAQPRPVR